MTVTADTAPATQPTSRPSIIAEIYGQKITAAELEPDENDQKQIHREVQEWERKPRAVKYPGGDMRSRLDWHYRSRLGTLIIRPLIQRFVDEHHLEPSKEEIQEYFDGMERLRVARQQADQRKREQMEQYLQRKDLTPEMKETVREDLEIITRSIKTNERVTTQLSSTDQSKKIYEQIAKNWVQGWKINKALYEKYGGRAIHQQLGVEPLEAYRKWLEEREQAGDFKFYEPEMRRVFYSYYKEMKHLDAKEPELFEKPLWLKEPEKEREYKPRPRPRTRQTQPANTPPT